MARHRSGVILCVLAALVLGCEEPEVSDFSFFDERIAPVLDSGCQRQTTGCHVDDGTGFALGNLDLTSYDALMRRQDTLPPYGPYAEGLLLLKAGDPVNVRVETLDPPDAAEPDRRYVTVTTDIRHGGGEGAIAQGSKDYSTLKQWIEGGHTRTGVSEVQLRDNIGKCVSRAGSAEGIDLDASPADADSFSLFVDTVQPVLRARCAGSACHGSRIADLYIACGEDEDQRRWNFAITLQHVDEVAVSSELLRRPLALGAGGVYHEGGDIFDNSDDPDYKTLLTWAEDVAERRPEILQWDTEDEGLRYFANRVQPVLVRKGCMFLNCHSNAMFHDLRLRGGARGQFAEIATRRNHEMSKLMLALESEDPNAGRLIAKNLCPSDEDGGRGQGVRHRGGALFEDFGGCAERETQASVDKCADVDVDGGDLNEIPAYCVLARWHEIEREQMVAQGALDSAGVPRGVVWVERPADVGGVLDFHEYRPGADLLWADASIDVDGGLTLGAARSLLGDCGLGDGPDVRNPAVSWSGARVAFAARSSESEPLRLYELDPDSGDCAPIDGIAPGSDSAGGILMHDFDPSYAPDGRIVFASTRGYSGEGGFEGPTRTPSSLAPNANIYVRDSDGSVRQLTYLLDQEVGPSFMADGRVLMTSEKRAEGFHQLAGRRQNLDGGDYHPLFAQRASIGFESATEIVELPNRNFAMVAAPIDTVDGGGAIVVVNRSIGPDQDDRDPDDRAYVHSLAMPAAGAFDGGTGAFRSPSPLPSGRLLAACDLAAGSLASGPHSYGLCELDEAGGEPRLLHMPGSGVAVEPVAVYARPPVPVFKSRIDEANGSSRIVSDATDAIVHVTDLPVLATLLFANTREGRELDFRVGGVELLLPQPPPGDATGFGGLGDVVEDDFGQFYQRFESLGSVMTFDDGSLRMQIPGGVPVTALLLDQAGDPLRFGDDDIFSGDMRQRESIQFYPGERAKQSIPRRLFNGLCGGCHGSISGRELDVVVDVDVLTSASRTLASDDLVDLR